jgi:FixJ family two-component response regulator
VTAIMENTAPHRSQPDAALACARINEKPPSVLIVDDDVRIRDSLSSYLASLGVCSYCFSLGEEVDRFTEIDNAGCVLLDLHLPDIDGLRLQQKITQQQFPPVVFITGDGDIPSAVQAMRAGAVDFLTKPIRESDLLCALNKAFAENARLRKERDARRELELCYQQLTPREREVMDLVVSGLLNKQTAASLGVSKITIEVHRGRIMRKMRASSLAALVKMAERLKT